MRCEASPLGLFNPALGRWDLHPHRKLSYHLASLVDLLPKAICPPTHGRFKMNESHYMFNLYA